MSLKSLDDGRESLDIEVDVDHEGRRVTLHMDEFDGPLVASFLGRTLAAEFAVCVSGAGQSASALPRYELVVILAGRSYPARVQRLTNGDFGVRLLSPVSAQM